MTSIDNLKQKLTTTLALLRIHNACEDGMQTLINFLGADYPKEKPINLLTILESNGVQHCIWAFRAIEQDDKKIICLIAADIAESVLHIYENRYPGDDRPRKAIQAARDYANAIINIHAAADAAANAADAAANAAANAAYAADAAANAADAAADAATDFADFVAAKKIEKEKQYRIIESYLIGNE